LGFLSSAERALHRAPTGLEISGSVSAGFAARTSPRNSLEERGSGENRPSALFQMLSKSAKKVVFAFPKQRAMFVQRN
jgi:hypothetical protein